jgi:transcription elongation GreA/GreB family factor
VLVGPIEADLERGRVSIEAPVGRALVGAAPEDIVTVARPKGDLRFQVVGVR